MDKKDTDMIKGTGVLLMLFYQLFAEEGRLLRYKLTGLPCPAAAMAQIASVGHLCVLLFVFVTAYGITVKDKEAQNQEQEKEKMVGSRLFALGFGRYARLVKKTAFLLAMLAIASYLWNYGAYPSALWGESRGAQALGMVGNALGLAGALQVSWFGSSWWYMGLYIAMLFAVPALYRPVKKLGLCASIAASAILPQMLGLNMAEEGLARYLVTVVLGVACAEFSVMEKAEGYFRENRDKRRIAILAAIIGFPATAYAIRFAGAGYLLENLLLLLTLGMAMLARRLTPLCGALGFVGRRSMTLWLVHEFIFGGRLQDILFGLKNIWAIWGAAVALSLVCAIALDGIYGCRTWALPEKIYATAKGKLLYAALAVAACYLIMASTNVMTYMTNDDGGIQSILSGDLTGSPYAEHQFIHIWLGTAIVSLYRAFPQVQWWYAYSHLLLLVGMLGMNFAVLCIGGRKGFTLRQMVPVLFMVDGGFFLHCIANLAFTVVPAVLGCGLVAVLFLMARWWAKKRLSIVYGMVLVGYALLLMHREATGLALLCYLMLMWLYVFVSRNGWKTGMRRFVSTGMVFVAVTAAIIGVGRAEAKNAEGADFIEFNAARAGYMDYPHDSYEDNKKLYQEVGWDKELADLVSCWFFMDERVTAESFRYITENSVSNASVLKVAGRTLADAFSDRGNQMLALLWMVSALFAVLLQMLKWRWDFFVFFLLNNIGSICLVLYQAVQGRLIYRSMYVVALPVFFINLLLALEYYECPKKGRACMRFLSYLCLAVCGICFMRLNFNLENKNAKMDAVNMCRHMEELASENTENIYIVPSGVYNKIHPDSAHPDTKKANIIGWGGSAARSECAKAQLGYNGLDSLSGDVLKQDNAYFLYYGNIVKDREYSGNGLLETFYTYLKKHFGAKGFVLKKNIDDTVYVYQFLFDGKEDSVEFYYDIVNKRVARRYNGKWNAKAKKLGIRGWSNEQR